MNVQTNLTGLRKAAVVALMIGEDASAQIFKHMTEDEIETLLSEMAALGRVSAKMGEQVLDEFNQTALAAEHVARGDISFAKRVLEKAFGPDTARKLMDRVMRSFQSTAGFASLEKADPQQLSKFILGEHPQTIALILAHLHPASAAQLITLLPDDLRVDVLTRMASLEDISPDVVSRISEVIDLRLKTLGGPIARAARRRPCRGGAVQPARADREHAGARGDRRATRPDLAVSIRNLMFVFDDLLNVDDNGMREIIQRADKKGLTIALKGASEEIRGRFFKNMSKRAGEMLKEEMDVLGAVRLRDVEKAQQEVVAIARKLEEEGLISTGAAAGEAYVV